VDAHAARTEAVAGAKVEVEAQDPSEMRQERTPRPPPPDLQELWFRTLQYDWSSLVVVPTHERCSAARIAQALGDMTALHYGKPITHIVASELDMGGTAELVTAMVVRDPEIAPADPKRPWYGRNLVVAIDPVITNPAGVAIVLAADAAILCVKLGHSRLDAAQRTIDLVGRERFIGCVLEK
jgi:hypothetical protein